MKDMPLYECPRFGWCSVNNCPLHPQYPDLFVSPLDEERICTLGKTYRQRIAEKYPGVLRFDGLKSREYKSLQKWNRLTPEEQRQRREKAKKNLFSSVSQNAKGKKVSEHVLRESNTGGGTNG